MMYRGTVSSSVSFDTKEELFAYNQGRAEALAELTQKHKFKCNQCKHFIKNIHRQAYGRCDIKNTESDKINFRSGSSQNCKLFEIRKE